MSLDIYITSPEEETIDCVCQHCENEHKRKYFPEIINLNLTHNLGRMAAAAGLYDLVWRPDENGVERCEQMIEYLRDGIERLQSDPVKYKEFNPSNGWGDYEGLVKTLQEYLEVCIENPKARIGVWR